jgi:PIN domain nuclease of toxin-antitoxin system
LTRSDADARSHLVVSAASVWELAIKQAKGKLEVPEGRLELLLDADLELLPVSPLHVLSAAQLPAIHGHDALNPAHMC